MNRWLLAAALLLPLVARAGDGGFAGVGESIAAVDPVILGHDLEFAGYARPASRGGTPPLFPLNDSGQAVCYGNDNTAAPCDPVGFPGQDGRFGRDAAAADEPLTKQGAGSWPPSGGIATKNGFWLVCATTIEKVLAMMNVPTKSEIPAKTSIPCFSPLIDEEIVSAWSSA